ncbi:helix-turn-helix protein [Elizabethkingia sp. YR214]|nr:helix-turn-helix protein [Elizabethkingia sp. YR214]
MNFNILNLFTFVFYNSKICFTFVIMEISDRIKKIIDHYDYSPSEFADTIDVPRSSISHITSGRNKASLDFIVKIKNRFPEIQWDWLIDGQGDMTKQAVPETEETDNSVEEINIRGEEEETSSPLDLFTLAPDFSQPITEESEVQETPSSGESDIPIKGTEESIPVDSQRLAIEEIFAPMQSAENQERAIKRIVFFFEDGKFEVFTP